MAVPAPNPFDGLPLETTQHIASYLDSDFDLSSFCSVSHSTNVAVNADNNSFWRRRYLAFFEKPTSWSADDRRKNAKYKAVYQRYRRRLLYGAVFKTALGSGSASERFQGVGIRKGTEALEVLKSLVCDAFSEKPTTGVDGTAVYESSNLEAILKFVDNHDLLDFVLLPDRTLARQRTTRHSSSMDVVCLPKALLQTIQVVLAPAMFDLNRNLNHFSFAQSQQAVYATAGSQKVFSGTHGLDVNMEWILHNINFWKHHMTKPFEQTLFTPFKDLADDERPRFWSDQLHQGSETLGTHWKGSYAYVDRDVLPDIRRGLNEEEPIVDEFNGDAEAGSGSFQDLTLSLVDEGVVHWPAIFEEHLKALSAPPSRAKTRAQKRSGTPESVATHKPLNFQFRGSGEDVTEDFLAQGWLNALLPQQDIPGWRRMTMMKYFEDPDTAEVDMDALWCYEGVVLPGGQMMLGRWWSAGDDYCGPFLLWNVDGPRYAEVETAVEGDDLP